jgi:hypothetical protein
MCVRAPGDSRRPRRRATPARASRAGSCRRRATARRRRWSRGRCRRCWARGPPRPAARPRRGGAVGEPDLDHRRAARRAPSLRQPHAMPAAKAATSISPANASSRRGAAARAAGRDLDRPERAPGRRHLAGHHAAAEDTSRAVQLRAIASRLVQGAASARPGTVAARRVPVAITTRDERRDRRPCRRRRHVTRPRQPAVATYQVDARPQPRT